MLESITPDEFEQMRQQLIVPLAVSDILRHNLNVEADLQYGLHMALSEVDPDSALLAIAMCAQDLATQYAGRVPIAVALQKEAIDILADYGPSWLRCNLKAPLTTPDYENILETVPEDLESLADLLDAFQDDLSETGSSATILANLLSIQARAHMEIAEFVLAEIAYEKHKENHKKNTPNFGYSGSEKAQSAQFQGDNIILFPSGAVD